MMNAWYQGRWWLWLLWPLSLLFRTLAKRRRRNLEAQQWQPQVPVIVVGNITLGGTGKTPVVIALIEWARQQGYTPGVVSRGYGAQAPEYPFSVQPDTPVKQAGDEPLLIVQRTGCALVTDPDRVAACQALVERHGCDLIISDDGLQHYRMGRTLELVVLDGSRGLGNGLCLPAGPLREPAERLEQVDLLLINGEGFSWPGAAHFSLEAAQLQPLNAHSDEVPAPQPVNAVAGIGNPERFFRTLQALGYTPVAHPFDDHHPFTQDDFAFDNGLPIVMTEKDAVKCRHLTLDNAYYLPVTARPDTEFFPQLAACLATKLTGTKNG